MTIPCIRRNMNSASLASSPSGNFLRSVKHRSLVVLPMSSASSIMTFTNRAAGCTTVYTLHYNMHYTLQCSMHYRILTPMHTLHYHMHYSIHHTLANAALPLALQYALHPALQYMHYTLRAHVQWHDDACAILPVWHTIVTVLCCSSFRSTLEDSYA